MVIDKMAKTIGIIGGMGPAATIDLLEKIYATFSAHYDQQHVRVLADIDPGIPDRTEAVLSNRRQEIVAHLLRNAKGLINQGADLLAMPCNTAHAFIGDLERELSVPFVNIVNVTVEHIKGLSSGTIGLMATDGTLAARLYIGQLEAQGVRVIALDSAHQAALMRAIYAFKSGDIAFSTETVIHIHRMLLSMGADWVVAACTELPIMLAGQQRVIDPTRLLALQLVNLAKIPGSG
jgi:aspartate racemase